MDRATRTVPNGSNGTGKLVAEFYESLSAKWNTSFKPIAKKRIAAIMICGSIKEILPSGL